MKYYNLIFAVFHLWRFAITTLDKHNLFKCLRGSAPAYIADYCPST